MKCIINHNKFSKPIEIDELDKVVKIDLAKIPNGLSFDEYIKLLRETGILIVDSKGHHSINRKGKKTITNSKGNIINFL